MWGTDFLGDAYFLWVQYITGKRKTMTKQQKNLALLGLGICYLGTIYLPVLLKAMIDIEHMGLRFLRYVSVPVLLCTGMLYYVRVAEQRSWASIGFKSFDGGRDVKWGMIGFGLGGMSFAITGPVVEMLGMESTRDGILKLMEYPLWVRVGFAVTAGITEEILFRTYPIERIREWSGNIWLAAFVSISLFAVLHLPFWSLGGGIQIGVGTIIWTLIYIKTRSIWAMMIMHVANDLFAFVMLPYMFGAAF